MWNFLRGIFFIFNDYSVQNLNSEIGLWTILRISTLIFIHKITETQLFRLKFWCIKP